MQPPRFLVWTDPASAHVTPLPALYQSQGDADRTHAHMSSLFPELHFDVTVVRASERATTQPEPSGEVAS